MLNLQTIAEDYNRKYRLGELSQGNTTLDIRLACKLARDYDKANHVPYNASVIASYAAFRRELFRQFEHLQASGIHFEPYTASGQPYDTASAMIADVRHNSRLVYFTFAELSSNHLLNCYAPNGIHFNNIFRCVHDCLGHARLGHDFSLQGEYNAFISHARMFTHNAQLALQNETILQTAWYYLGPYNGLDYSMRPFAPQKNTLVNFRLGERQ